MNRITICTLLLLVLSACGDIDKGVRGGIEVVSTGNPKANPSNFGGGQSSSLPSSRIVAPPAAQADAFAVSFLNSIQARSFRERRELCGYFILLPNGHITATQPIPGTFASCEQPIPQPGQGVFASYHTHGAYGPEYDNEVPSPTDLLSDFEFGMDGYVSTPGGRVWRIEYDTRDTLQVCGQGCIAVDPGFVPQNESSITSRFTVNELRRRNG
jgi:hypothetical protein